VQKACSLLLPLCITGYKPYHLCLLQRWPAVRYASPRGQSAEGMQFAGCLPLQHILHTIPSVPHPVLCLLQRWHAVGHVPRRGQSTEDMPNSPAPLHHNHCHLCLTRLCLLQRWPAVRYASPRGQSTEAMQNSPAPLHHNQCHLCLTQLCLLQRWPAVGYVPGRGQSAKGMQHWVGRCLQRCQT